MQDPSALNHALTMLDIIEAVLSETKRKFAEVQQVIKKYHAASEDALKKVGDLKSESSRYFDKPSPSSAKRLNKAMADADKAFTQAETTFEELAEKYPSQAETLHKMARMIREKWRSAKPSLERLVQTKNDVLLSGVEWSE